ncbi:MAG: 3-oxoacyl-ACP synthase III family protein [Crocinitomicaceae bacterium]
MNIELSHIEYFLPEIELTNSHLAKRFNKSEDEIYKSTGVRARRIRSESQIGSDLGFHAAERLLSNFPELKKKIDLLIFCTEGLDYKAPTTSSTLHFKLGLEQNCACIDMPMGCAGFVYGLSLAKSFLLSEDATCVLFITADIPSAGIHSDDYEMRSIFGDAGVASIIQKSKSGKIGRFIFGTDGAGAANLIVRKGATRNPIDQEWLEKFKDQPGRLSFGRIEMNGLEIARFSLQKVPTLLDNVLHKNELSFEQIDLFIFHQASDFILKALKRKCKIPDDKFYTYFENIGNTVSCSIPIALYHAEQEGKLKRGDKVMLLGFGVGYSWAGTIIEY